ncbi:gliding motility-associated C-terminal domain-containing protein [Draconibacterium sp. IB214405]|uniref:T9SS type B sorting domain-containing protein n=1 Tax=Draconibacterium sp. IB214405 TaxID=3097352 RepID=UPI002A14E665|nr:gliding motility-associated C-terminal domain-containing protein [Draconibacterium sp. IB214405]MDX8340785.1 gliding motility-associated C-terminal domain-containing protein [Draconibacterium sp. IB214405]
MKRSLFIVIILVFSFSALRAQISSPGADASEVTQYPVYTETDSIFIFCSSGSSSDVATLTAGTELTGTKNWLWEKYNSETASFEPYFEESTDAATSQINELADGCYRVTITQGATTEIDRAWVFNSWILAEPKIPQSDCESFTLSGSYTASPLNYFDLSDNSPLELIRQINVEWLEGSVKWSSLMTFEFRNPPTENTDYTLRVYDQYNCEGRTDITYESIVTKASFTASPMSGEAPLEVSFSNNSENGTAGYYEWFFYRDLSAIIQDSEGTTEPVDSIDFVAYDDAPVYTYENSGTYMVKLVSKHLSDTLTCVDTAYLEDYIEVDTSFIAVPNVFTPNGDGTNDEFVVRFWSMQSIEISIFNRWGKRVHYWESGDVRGFEDSYTESVWDGRIGGRFASPGVYFYDVVGRGRDGVKRKKHGFVHLFRDK